MEFKIYFRWTDVPLTVAEQVERILIEAFPEDERRDMEEIHRILNGGWLELLTLETADRVLGILLVWNLEGMVFLENFAIAREERGKGLGSKMLDHVWRHWEKPIILEVEPPEDETKKKRIAFYRRNGFHLSDYPYAMPDLHGGDEVLPLLLMSRPSPMNWEKARRIALRLYETVYREKKCPEFI